MHWVAGVLGAAIVLLFVVFAIGERAPAALLLRPQSWALLIMLTGFILIWWHDLAGGVISLFGIAAFYLFSYLEVARLPGGWVFPLCFLPGGLAVTAWLMRARAQPASKQ
jgi:amino acid permease